jgi:hypothetical protein
MTIATPHVGREILEQSGVGVETTCRTTHAHDGEVPCSTLGAHWQSLQMLAVGRNQSPSQLGVARTGRIDEGWACVRTHNEPHAAAGPAGEAWLAQRRATMEPCC